MTQNIKKDKHSHNILGQMTFYFSSPSPLVSEHRDYCKRWIFYDKTDEEPKTITLEIEQIYNYD